MSSSRSRSQNESPYKRKRSSTVQSSLRSPVQVASPLTVGDSTILKLWVHDPEKLEDVVFNTDYWPGVSEGDMIRVTEVGGDEDADPGLMERDGFLFVVKRPGDETPIQNALQISISRPKAEAFGMRNNSQVRLTKVDSLKLRADYIEIEFQDQYLGRSDMWRLGKQLQGQCIHVGQQIVFVGSPTGKIRNMYIEGKNVSAGLVTSLTRFIYRSLSAKITIFIQVCRELWEFAMDGERYSEKVVHSFLPALFRRWHEADTNHIVTIVLISRVYYLDSEKSYAAGPLRCDDDGRWYKDFYKVITDLEILQDWRPTLVSLKESFVAFHRDILLTHHYHASQKSTDEEVKPQLVGRISFAHEGPILEALNLALNPMETHYVDRSLSLTGAGIILVTPGTGYYRVSKSLLRMTTTRLLDQGFGLDIVALAKHPLHQSPIFSFKGYEPGVRPDSTRSGWRSNDPLWGGDDDGVDIPGKEKSTFWWEPFWVAMSFWDLQLDQPFRQDRFVARARMHQIEMLGLLEHDVLASINVPYLSENSDSPKDQAEYSQEEYMKAQKLEAEKFDHDRFSLRKAPPIHLGRDSAPSSGNTITLDQPYRNVALDKRASYTMARPSVIYPRITPIEESPKRVYKDLPLEEGKNETSTITVLSTSPSSSVITSKSEETSRLEENKGAASKLSLGSKLASSWLFNPFRATNNAPTSSASESDTEAGASTPTPTSALASGSLNAARPSGSAAVTMTQARTPRPMSIRNTPARRSLLGQGSDEDTISSSSRSNTFVRHSPLGRASPLGVSPRSRDDPILKNRRATISSLNVSLATSSPVITNPLRQAAAMPYAQTSLASRWQHMFPQPLYKHQIKWKSMVTPGCLPLTTEYFPTKSELETSYDVFSYEFVIDFADMKSFFIKNPIVEKDSIEEVRKAWALEVMRGMASQRLVQGFQFIVQPKLTEREARKNDPEVKYFSVDDDRTPKPTGASDIFHSNIEPVFLSMSNEIHRISYNGEAIQVRRYVRRMPTSRPINYKCLVWPKDGVGYTELSTSFGMNGLESYGWNGLDMLIAGYNYHQFNDSYRYWRTRFIVIPTIEAPPTQPVSKLNDEEIRLMGSDKLAEIWTKLRWVHPSERERGVNYPPVRFLPTTLSPTASVVDEQLVSQLDAVMASGPQGKNMKSEREIAEMSQNLPALAKLMREDRGMLIKLHKWHNATYEDSFTGYDFASWLWREFRDVSTREQAQEWGNKLLEQGLIEHCRGRHKFLDGHYFYHLRDEYTVPRTPKSGRGWSFRSVSRHVSGDEKEAGKPMSYYPGNGPRGGLSSRKNRKRLVVSQTLVIDVDPNNKSDQAESVILHHDLIHNPANVFHFELHWLGTTARCIEEQIRIWGSKIERYGLKLVEAYVTQISDIRERNPFQSCYPIRLAVPPPKIPDLDQRLRSIGFAEPTQTPLQYFFEYALLKKFMFILDIEATDLYPEQVDVFYSYRKQSFSHSQFVHRTGVAFVQVRGGEEGFLFLTNRLMGPGHGGSGLKNRGIRPAAAAEELRLQMNDFCQDKAKLNAFYDEILKSLPSVEEEEPPPLTI